MIALSNEQLESLLSLTGNNKCLECDKNSVDWVTFPTTVFLCSSCCRLHKNFSKKETLKSVSISEFTQEEISKMNIGGNARYFSLLNEYKISLNEPNIEHKYKTVLTSYYNALLDAEVKKIRQSPGAEEIYNKIINQKPSLENGPNLVDENSEYFAEVKSTNNNEQNQGGFFFQGNSGLGLGGLFSYLGNQISNAGEKMGINKYVSDAKTGFDNAMENYGIKEKVNKTVDYAKIAGNYIVDKGKEIVETPVMQDVVNKVSEGVNVVKESASNMISNIASNVNGENIPLSQNLSGDEHPNNTGSNNTNQNVYQQLNNDQL